MNKLADFNADSSRRRTEDKGLISLNAGKLVPITSFNFKTIVSVKSETHSHAGPPCGMRLFPPPSSGDATARKDGAEG